MIKNAQRPEVNYPGLGAVAKVMESGAKRKRSPTGDDLFLFR
jgi:hypothetical protein